MAGLKPAAVFCLGLFACIGFRVCADEPEFPTPKNAQVSIVSKNMTVGGRTMSIRQFYTRDNMDRVRKFYYRHWQKGEKKDMPGYLTSDDNPPWHIISRIEEGFLMTVQVQEADDGGSWGYLAISKLVQPLPEESAGKSVPKIPGSEIVHDMQTRDVGQSGETVMITNKHSLASNTVYYRSYYGDRGWRTDIDQAIPAAKMHVLAFTKGQQKINIVIAGGSKGSQVVVNRVSHDIL